MTGLRAAFVAGELPKSRFIERMHAERRRLFDVADLLRDSEIAAVEVRADGVTMTSAHGVVFEIDPADHRSPPVEALNFGRYESDDADLLFAAIADGATVFDVGANVGWYALHIARRYPKCRVHAFEPVPTTFAALERNLRRNDLPNVTPHPFGFGEVAGEATFFVYPEGPGGASAANNSGRPSVREVRVPLRTLDEFVATSGVRPDVLKIDVEGAEWPALKGAAKTLADAQPTIFAEMLRKWAANFGYHPNDMIGWLADLGYTCRTADGAIEGVTDATTATNYLFQPREPCP